MRLENGAEIIRIKLNRVLQSEDRFGGVVMAHRPGHPRDPFVTWRVWSEDNGQTFHAETGHYFGSFNEASMDFDERHV